MHVQLGQTSFDGKVTHEGILFCFYNHISLDDVKADYKVSKAGSTFEIKTVE